MDEQPKKRIKAVTVLISISVLLLVGFLVDRYIIPHTVLIPRQTNAMKVYHDSVGCQFKGNYSDYVAVLLTDDIRKNYYPCGMCEPHR